MVVRAFSVTIATASMPYTVSQAMHSDEEINLRDEVVFCCCERLSIYEKKDAAVRINYMKLTTVKCTEKNSSIGGNINIKRDLISS